MMETKIENKLNKKIVEVLKDSCKDDSYFDTINNITYTSLFNNKMLIVGLIRQGIPYSLFTLIQDFTPFSENDWAGFLDISTKSLHRYKQVDKNFKPIQSEKIIELAEVTSVGLEVFGNMEKFKLWLDTPNYALGNLKPVELLKDSYGKDMVVSELTRINHGIFA
jgi:putative toxin-antitoxin system antitoxin component (TIGR02293 family)